MERFTPKIVVTGGMGYIGSHTTVLLLNAGYRVVILDNLSNSNKSILQRIEQITGKTATFYEVDLCDKAELSRVFDIEKDIAASIHFAALKAVGESVENPLLYYKNNLISLLNLLEVQQESGIQNLVFSSSCTVYGEPDTLPVTEQSPVKQAVSPYGNTKQIGEEIISDACRSSKLNAIALRYFNPVGAHESALIGELPNGIPNNLVPFITQSAIGKRAELKVFGNDYSTPDGTCIRDYIHVEDVAAAHVAALKRLENESLHRNSRFEVFNIGTGRGHSVMEIINSFEQATGCTLNYSVTARRPGDIEKVYADTQLSNKVLGWEAHKTIAEMMSSAWKWELENLKNPIQ
ncbi:MAG: UDP-glucose 4-epimerase GalE [Bacteroidia bacterium]